MATPPDGDPGRVDDASHGGPAVELALVDEAVDLARRAGELSLRWFRTADLRIDRKGDGTPVTEADRAVERFLREEIGRSHPGDGIVGEEEAPVPSSSGREWVLDPIDGTKAFSRSVPLYANLLALDDEYGNAVGVINIPALGEMVWAGRGRGCFLNGAPARVSDRDTLDGAYVSSSGYESWADDALLNIKRAGAVLRTWGDGYGYLLVATGRIDAMVDPAAERYDLAPLPVILSEAGGAFSDYQGGPSSAGGSGVATNGRIHQQLLTCLGP
ncbi:MAG TPA: inositol monophosphatase family protein [Acidimicrobiales bacterium]|nr:inositol monophosphatase family protein [Acidimicrobiales bacterium]